ncbi:Hypothetical protein GSB_150905, partial [Giardia duodenalis]
VLMLHLELREIFIPQRIAGTRATLTLTFRNRFRDTVDCEFAHSGSLRRRQTNGSVFIMYPSEITTPIPWMSHLSHELTATIEISDADTVLYETAIRVAPLKMKHVLSGERMFLELPMDKVSCSAVCVCMNMSERSSKVFLQNMPLHHILPLFPRPIVDCYLVADAGYTIKRSIYDQRTKTITDKVPISLVSKPKRVSIAIRGFVGDVLWESTVYNGEIDPKTGELVMYELINALDVLAIGTLSTLHKSIFNKTKASQSRDVKSDRSISRKEKRQQEKEYKLLLSACILEGVVAAPTRGTSLSRTRGPSVLEVLASIKGLSHENLDPIDLLASYSTRECDQSILDGLKTVMLGCSGKWIITKRIRNWISAVDYKHLLASLAQSYISPRHLAVPERIGKSQLHDILRDCDDDNVCYVLSILCRDAMTLPKVVIGENTYFAPTSNEQVFPQKWLQTSDDSMNSIHRFCIAYDIPQKSVCNFLWERLCIADPSNNTTDPTAEMVMNKLSLLLTTVLDTGTAKQWCNGLGETHTLRSLFIDLIIYIVTTADILPLHMLYQTDAYGPATDISQVYESEESILCVDPLEEIRHVEQITVEEDGYPKALVFSRHVQQHNDVVNSPSSSIIKPAVSTIQTTKSTYEQNPSASQSLYGQGETRMLHSLSSEVSLSIADLATEPKNESCETANRVMQAKHPAIPRPKDKLRGKFHAQPVSSSAIGMALAGHAISGSLSDVSCLEDDVILSTIDHTDRSKSSMGGSRAKTVVNPTLNQTSESSHPSFITISRLNTPTNNSSDSLLPIRSNAFVDLVKLMIQKRVLPTSQEAVDRYTGNLIEGVVTPANQFVHPAWGHKQINAMRDLCVAAAHLHHTTLKLSTCIESVDKERVKLLIANILSDSELERLLLSFTEPLLCSPCKLTSSTKETQTVSSFPLTSPHKLSCNSSLDFSLIWDKMRQNDKVIDSVLERATTYASSLTSNRCTVNTTFTSSAQRSTETPLSGNTGFARSSSKDTNYLFEPNYESRAGTPDICQMLESVESGICDQESTIWDYRTYSHECQGLILA